MFFRSMEEESLQIFAIQNSKELYILQRDLRKR